MKTRTLLILLLACTGCSRPQEADRPPRSPQGRPPVTELLASLGGHEHVPGRAELAALGAAEGVTGALREIYRDRDQPLLVRIRALTSLRFYPGPESRAVFEQVLGDPQTGDPVRRAALKAYAWAFPAESVPALSRLLRHPEIHTREAAVRSLAEIGTTEAAHALRDRLSVETEPFIRQSIEVGLAR